MLPPTQTRITLGEGSTPLVPLHTKLKNTTVLGKLESQNPTLSFKDRGMALATSVAVDQGKRGLIVASTGNAAVSAAAYAAAASLSCRVIVASASNALAKLESCREYGANVTEISGDFSDAYAAAAELAGQDFMNVSTTYQNEYITHGYGTVAAELLEPTPDIVIVPIGAGPLLTGIARGFTHLIKLGKANKLPVLVGVQAEGCAPLARAWAASQNRKEWLRLLRAPLRTSPTEATAIADPLRGYEAQGLITLDTVQRTGGSVVAVEEDKIIDATLSLRQRGLWVEPSSATALAALDKLQIPEGSRVVLMLTGHGIKSPQIQR